MNVDIFACIHFRELTKIGYFAWTSIRVFADNDSIWHNITIFQVFVDILQIFEKRKNMYSAIFFYIHTIWDTT